MEICRRIEDYIVGSPEFAKPFEVPTFVRVDAFNASSIDIMVYGFTIDAKWGEWLRIKEGLAYRIERIVEEAGTAFAFPSQSLVANAPIQRPRSAQALANAPVVAQKAANPARGRSDDEQGHPRFICRL